MIGADGGTGPSASSLSPEPLKRVMAPYPIVPATAKIAKFVSMAEEGDDFLEAGSPPLVDNIRWT